MLAKVLCRGGNVIVLDEPTNDLDLQSLRMLEEALADFDGTVLVVSHDRYFLDRICDQIIAFEGDDVLVHTGNYSYYLDKKTSRSRTPEAAPASVAKPSAPQRTRKLSYKEQRELEGIEERIQHAEQEASKLENLLDDPSFFVTRGAEAPALVEKLALDRKAIAALYERWEFLASAL